MTRSGTNGNEHGLSRAAVAALRESVVARQHEILSMAKLIQDGSTITENDVRRAAQMVSPKITSISMLWSIRRTQELARRSFISSLVMAGVCLISPLLVVFLASTRFGQDGDPSAVSWTAFPLYLGLLLCVVVIAISLFKRITALNQDFSRMLPRIDVEAESGRGLTENINEVDYAGKPNEVFDRVAIDRSQGAEADLLFLREWNEIEVTIQKLGRRYFPTTEPQAIPFGVTLSRLHGVGVISEDIANLVRELSIVRNRIVHGKGHDRDLERALPLFNELSLRLNNLTSSQASTFPS
jgi:hypothetical protein